MDAKEKLIKYAQEKNTLSVFTAEEFVGKMILEGVVISRTPNSKTIARAARQGKTIIVTETAIITKNEIVSGKVVARQSETTSEIFRVELQ